MKTHWGLSGMALSATLLYALWPAPLPNVGLWQRTLVTNADTITQTAPFEQLARGGFDGTTTVEQLRRGADFGMGTFTGLDGEMIMLDGVVYQAPSSGVLRVATDAEAIPFATLTRFRPERSFVSSGTLADFAALQAFLDSQMPDQSQILAVKAHGTFRTLKVRAPRKQARPYPTLAEALKTQAIFEFTSVGGTLVGFRFPPYFGTVNSPGYHLHFVSDDRRIGGHVLELSAGAIVFSIETVEQYNVTMAPAD